MASIHVYQGRYPLLMDLPTGCGPQGLNADIFSATPERLAPHLAGAVSLLPNPRLVRLSANGGYGINDAPAPAGAHVGIAMQKGADITGMTADMRCLKTKSVGSMLILFLLSLG